MRQHKRRARPKAAAKPKQAAPPAQPVSDEAVNLALPGPSEEGRIEAAQREAVDQSVQDPLHDWPGTDTDRGPANRWMYVDPFYGGELLDSADVCRRIAETTGLVADNPAMWLSPASHRQWISRMLNNLQAVFAHTGRERDLFAMQELQELLA